MTGEYWADLGPADDFPTDKQACVRADGVPMVVMNVAGELYALENRCPPTPAARWETANARA